MEQQISLRIRDRWISPISTRHVTIVRPFPSCLKLLLLFNRGRFRDAQQKRSRFKINIYLQWCFLILHLIIISYSCLTMFFLSKNYVPLRFFITNRNILRPSSFLGCIFSKLKIYIKWFHWNGSLYNGEGTAGGPGWGRLYEGRIALSTG